ncbi:hypothetical protein [Bacillus haynesii]|uniref:hypothetical protein n=1 Tax=Bacillus haynesii TaxID=1925021 RepID=UPI00227EF64F|nr:hypothetical protein [Bacillus haynesii]MCY9324070.1 hypothetical protein [Bacillus haynesii]
MYKVKVKARGFNGVRAGVHFRMGVGEFEDEKLIPVFERLGYEVIKPEEPKKDTKKDTKKAPKKEAPKKGKKTTKAKEE